MVVVLPRSLNGNWVMSEPGRSHLWASIHLVQMWGSGARGGDQEGSLGSSPSGPVNRHWGLAALGTNVSFLPFLGT